MAWNESKKTPTTPQEIFNALKEQISAKNSDDKSTKKLLKELLKELKNNTKVFDQTNKEGNTLLHLTIEKDYNASSKYLIAQMTPQQIAKKNKAYGNTTALHWAIDKKQRDIIKPLLMKNSGLASLANNCDENPLHWTVKKGLLDIGKLLLDINPNLINQQDKKGKTALHWAVEYNKPGTTKFLLTNCPEQSFLNIKDLEGQTALNIALNEEKHDIARLINYYDTQKYFINLDDSSDEEDSVTEYQVARKLEDFIDSCEKNDKKAHSFKEIITIPNFFLSFITHAAGIYLFYAPKVQKEYYELKKEHLITLEDELPQSEEINKNFKNGINKIHEVCNNTVMGPAYGAIKKTNEECQKHYKDQEKQYEDNINAYLTTNLLDIQKNVFSFTKLEDLIDKILPEIDRHSDGPIIMARELFVPRKILQLENLYSENNLEFLAKLRLHNRSEKRKCKNFQDKPLNTKEQEEYYPTKITLNNTVIGNSTVILKTNILRSEVIQYKPNHEKELRYQNIFQQNFIDKSMLNSVQPTNSTFFYHLFGCETIKNPAAFIHNKIVLDLIKAKGKLTWEEALVKQELPMTMTDAIVGARIVNSDYNNFMPHEYLYDREYKKLKYCSSIASKNKSAATNLLIKEINITEKWLEWKLGKSISEYMVNNCCKKIVRAVDNKKDNSKGSTTKYVIDHEAVNAVWGLILEACEEWYPEVLGAPPPPLIEEVLT